MGDSHHQLRKPGWAVGPALAVALMLTLFAPSSAHASLFGQFAGYLRFGPTRSVSAQWAVPEISSSSPWGVAATWVGAEAPGYQDEAPFIQVGLDEERTQVSQSDKTLVNHYYAFWSDTDKGFHLHRLFAVTPGDQIVASLTLSGHRWQVDIQDVTAGVSRSFVTTDEGQAKFNLAMWLQENPTIGDTFQLPYPTLGPVGFQSLLVNGVAPTAGSLLQAWMSARRQTFGPTPLSADSFQIQNVTPSVAVEQYIRVVRAFDSEWELFVPQLDHWTSRTHRRVVVAACRELAAAAKLQIERLRRDSWPVDVRPAIRRMIRRTVILRTATVRFERVAPRRRATGRVRLKHDRLALHDAAVRVDTELGAPRFV